jgi:hypothetical protein
MKSALIILALATTVLAQVRTCVHERFLREHVCFHCQDSDDAAAFALLRSQRIANRNRNYDIYDIFARTRDQDGNPILPNVYEDAAYVDQRNNQALCRIDGQTAYRCKPVAAVHNGPPIRFNCRRCRNSPNVSSWSTQNNGHLSYTSDVC